MIDTARYTAHRAIESYYERYFDINTGREIMLDTLGIHDPDAVRYSPSPYPGFFKAMRLVRVDSRHSTFVDYGSGLGRIVICAATWPFKRVIGVELSSELTSRAAENIERARRRLSCEIELTIANAARWQLPDEANILHLYNPFLNDTLRAVVSDIARSLRQAPREMWIVFGSPWQMSTLMTQGSIIPIAWQKGSDDVPWWFRKGTDPNGYRYRVYRLDSR